MNEHNGRTLTVWATPENAARIDYAKKLKLNVSKIVNEILDEHLKPKLEQVRTQQMKEIRDVLSVPVP